MVNLAGDVAEHLAVGDLTVTGLLVDSSNHAMVGEIGHGGEAIRCVYKPLAGERPLWDFPDGRLAAREVAAYQLAQLAGWNCVPATVFRDGPAGPGMVQEWIDDADPDLLINIFRPDEVPADFLPVFRAEDQDGLPLVVAHADDPELARIALFDALINNADRKGSHLLARPGRSPLGVDHGLTFHPEPKLRTVLWGWAGEAVPAELMDGLQRVREQLAAADSAADTPGADSLSALLGEPELDALRQRADQQLRHPVFPLPPDNRPALPWPPL